MISRIVPQLATRHHQLLLIVGPHGSGKTKFLRACQQSTPCTYLNLSLALSRRLLDFKTQDRPAQALNILDDLFAGQGVLLLDNIELLFEVTLQLDPLRALKRASRGRPIVAAWPGMLDGGSLVYAAPGHPEYRRYEPQDLEDIVIWDVMELPPSEV